MHSIIKREKRSFFWFLFFFSFAAALENCYWLSQQEQKALKFLSKSVVNSAQ